MIDQAIAAITVAGYGMLFGYTFGVGFIMARITIGYILDKGGE